MPCRDHPVRKFYEAANKKGYLGSSINLTCVSIGSEYRCEIFVDGILLASECAAAKNSVKKLATSAAMKKLKDIPKKVVLE